MFHSFPMLSKAKAKDLAELLQKKHRRERGEFLVEGLRICKDLLQNRQATVKTLLVSERLLSQPQGEEVLAQYEARKMEIWQVSEQTLERLSDTCSPQPIMAVVAKKEEEFPKNFQAGKRFLVLVDIADPGNVGTLLRSADAFGWDSVLCVGESADIYNPKVLRASMGAFFRLKIACTPLATIMSFFGDKKIPYFVTMPHEGKIPPYENLPAQFALFLGSEAHGLPSFLQEKAYQNLRLPMAPTAESLNVAVAGGIFLFLLRDIQG